MHVAAALARLPEVQHPAANRRIRVGSVLRLLAGGLQATAARLDPHQLSACLAAFGRLRMAPPAAAALVCSLLCADGGAPLRKLHPWELAEAAEALAALQQEEEVLRAEAAAAAAADAAGAAGADDDRLSIFRGGAALNGAEGQPGTALAASPGALPLGPPADGALALEAFCGERGAGGATDALARVSPAAALWQLLADAARPRLRSFPAADLAALTWALARSGRASKRFMGDASSAARAGPGRFDSDGVARMASALAAAGHRDEFLLGALGREVALRKAEFTVPQLAGGPAWGGRWRARGGCRRF
jgi:hypothetical protein